MHFPDLEEEGKLYDRAQPSRIGDLLALKDQPPASSTDEAQVDQQRPQT
jgi:hypothetical protein